jgi:2-dehydro-3-deoxyphosphogalactonate aldolase
MKISDAKTFVVANPPPSFGGRYWVFIKLVTDSGIVGYGEVYSLPFHPIVVAKMVEDVCARHVIGADPFRIEQLWRVIFSAGYSQRSGTALMGVLSSIEMACWDIVGKEVDRPIYDLLGGRVRERIRSYTYLYPSEEDIRDVYMDPDLAAERAAEYVTRGFTAVKFDPVGPYTAYDPRQLSRAVLSRSETFVRKIREAVGDRADILLGTHGQMTAAAAIRLARVLEPYDPLWFEEPVPAENEDEMAKVARAISIPVATGERLTSKYEFQRILSRGAAAILQMNLGRVGGILEAKKIAGMAEANYLQIAPHLYCGPIVGAAAIQLGACSPNLLIQEGILDWGGFHSEILRQPVEWEEGYILLPTAPGLGVELDEAVAEAHPYTDTELHLTTEEHEPKV